MGQVIGVVGFFGLFVFLVMLIIVLVKKKDKKASLSGILICLALFIVGMAITPDSDSSPSSSSSSNPLMSADEITQDVYNGSGTEVIGQECRVVVSKDELKSITEGQFSEFVKNRVDGQSYNWYTIASSDFGVEFYNCSPDAIVYGPIGSDPKNFYVVSPVEGYITKDSSGNYLIQNMQDSINTD